MMGHGKCGWGWWPLWKGPGKADQPSTSSLTPGAPFPTPPPQNSSLSHDWMQRVYGVYGCIWGYSVPPLGNSRCSPFLLNFEVPPYPLSTLSPPHPSLEPWSTATSDHSFPPYPNLPALGSKSPQLPHLIPTPVGCSMSFSGLHDSPFIHPLACSFFSRNNNYIISVPCLISQVT